MNNTNVLSSYDFYKEYHQNYYNKLLHIFSIQLIMVSMMTFFKNINISDILYYIKYNPKQHSALMQHFTSIKKLRNMELNIIITYFYILYYSQCGISTFYMMWGFFHYIYCLTKCIDFTRREAFFIFCIAWVLQFLGHYIEGRRPALVDSVGQAFLGAPLFTVLELNEIHKIEN